MRGATYVDMIAVDPVVKYGTRMSLFGQTLRTLAVRTVGVRPAWQFSAPSKKSTATTVAFIMLE
jgi:hypothetical protein